MKKFKGFIPKELLDSISEKKCILFVGAGLSSNAIRSNGKPLPTWKGLLSELLEYCVDKRIPFSVNVKDLEEMIANNNLIMVAQEIQETITKHDFGEFLQQLSERNQLYQLQLIFYYLKFLLEVS